MTNQPISLAWAGTFALCLALVVAQIWVPGLKLFPAEWALPVADWFNTIVTPVFTALRPLGIGVAGISDAAVGAIRAGLQWVQAPCLILAIALVALRASGWWLAVFACVALAGIWGIGYWPKAMNTLALVLISVPLSVLLGFAIGALGHRFPRGEPALVAGLDVMQTYPAFGYLIPLLLVFGFGPTAGLAASIAFSIPPMVRNTLVGLRDVPPDIIESATMAGATPRQNFWFARVPSALPQLLVGVNQTTMASLSMVIIIAIIGGFDDIGWEVLSAMRSTELGRSLAAGLVIVLIAVLLDRITAGMARRARPGQPGALGNRGLWLGLLACMILAVLLRMGGLWADYNPGAASRLWVKGLDRTLLDFVGWSAPFFSAFRNGITYTVMLPMRLGFSGSASPMVWGFALTPTVVALYVMAVAVPALWEVWKGRMATGLTIGFMGLLIWTGLPGFPWPGVFAVVGLASWKAGGCRLAALSVSGLLLVGVSGLWGPMMQSIHLCAVAVGICVLVGGALGVWAAESDHVSRILRPINDMLQTMPQFVFLIPALMLFKVGEFTALIAIILYAIVPPIRYVEHGLRNVRHDLVEAGTQMGATRRQMLWQIKLPLAASSVRLGINQTIMAALSMLVIAALVGTRDLGQQVYVALSKADAGAGLIAGWAIACIALVSDRLLRPSRTSSPEPCKSNAQETTP